jgi:nucleoid DNA-binding protein
MAKLPMEGPEQIVAAVQTALGLTEKKEAEKITKAVFDSVYQIVSSHIDQDGYTLRVPSLGKLIVKHNVGKLRKNPFRNGELTQTSTKRKVKFTTLGDLRKLEVVK